MRVVDDYESLLNELDLILERAHDSFSNVIDMWEKFLSHMFLFAKKINLLFQICPLAFLRALWVLGSEWK